MLAYIPYMDPMGIIYLIYHAPLQFVGYSKHLPGLTRQLMAWCLRPDVRRSQVISGDSPAGLL